MVSPKDAGIEPPKSVDLPAITGPMADTETTVGAEGVTGFCCNPRCGDCVRGLECSGPATSLCNNVFGEPVRLTSSSQDISLPADIAYCSMTRVASSGKGKQACSTTTRASWST